MKNGCVHEQSKYMRNSFAIKLLSHVIRDLCL